MMILYPLEKVLFAVAWALILIGSAVVTGVVFSKKSKTFWNELRKFGWLYAVEGVLVDDGYLNSPKWRRVLCHFLVSDWLALPIDKMFWKIEPKQTTQVDKTDYTNVPNGWDRNSIKHQ
jgi:hypothetical protein